MNQRDLDNLRTQVEQQAQEKHELQFKLDTSAGDSATVQRDYQLIQDQNLRLLDENNGMRGRVNDLSNQNRELDLKVSQLMAQRVNPPIYEERNPGLDRSVVSQ
jgi:predicted nuclease with TOPRIM domain